MLFYSNSSSLLSPSYSYSPPTSLYSILIHHHYHHLIHIHHRHHTILFYFIHHDHLLLFITTIIMMLFLLIANIILFLFTVIVHFILFLHFQRSKLNCFCRRYLNSNDYEGGFEMPQVEALLSTIESNFQTWARYFAGLAVGPDHPSEAAKFCKTLQRMGSDVALSIAREVFLSDFRHLLERVEVPCTIVNGPRDFVVPAFVPLYMQTKLKGEASLELIDFDGHFPQFTAPRLLADVITRQL